MSSTTKTFAPITESSRALRWGFLGCGKISSDFANALKHLPNAVFQACAARSKESAQAFADLHGFARAYDSYEQLVSYADIDVVYIGTLHISHYENTLLALNHGKHVIVEKPMTMNAREAARVIALAKEKNLFFMEGMWTRFFPTVRFVREQLANDVIGDVHHVRANIGFPFAEDNARLWQRNLGGGGLLDIGIYPLAFVTMVFGTKPEKITASGKLSSDGVDVYGAVALEYSGNCFGSIDYTCLALFDENVTIIGSKGRIVIHGPAHCGTTVITTLYGADGSLTDKVSHFPKVQPHPSSSPVIYGGSEGFYHEIEAVTQAILHNLTEQPEYPPSESLGIMTIMDEIRKQLGVVYPADAHN